MNSTLVTCSVQTSDCIMRRLILIIFLLILLLPRISGQVKVKLTCPDSWGPGKYSKVTVDLVFGRAGSFARFTQDYPDGFEIEPDIITTGDFSWSDNQLNVVWMDLPEDRIVSFSYFVKPEISMNGSVDLEARVVLITGGDTRSVYRPESKKITIGGTGGVTDIEKPSERFLSGARYEFRVQVTTSSTNDSEEVRKRLRIERDDRITVVKSGNIFKYQAGSFSDYESARKALERYIGIGIKDAFIVAYDGNEQVPVNRALNEGR